MTVDLAEIWIVLAIGLLAAVATYRAERRAYGGLGLATILAGSVVTYNLLNPLFYLVSPLLTVMFTLEIGFYVPPSSLLPNALATSIFLVSLAATAFYAVRVPGSAIGRGLRPIPQAAIAKLVPPTLAMGVVGLVFWIARNIAAYGSWNGAFAAEYGGETARPQVPFFGAYVDIWSWAIQVVAIVGLWQHAAGRARRWILGIPLLLGGLLAVIEGNRGLLTAAVLVYAGWFGLRARLTAKRVFTALLALTVLTLVANARYNKGETSLTERVQDIFRPEYFRPFWSGDPYGVAVSATFSCLRATQEGIDFGATYVRNLAAMTPRVIWPGRPEDSATEFAKWFDDQEDQEYAPGAGYAFSAIAESFMCFWYVGPVLLGFLCGRAADWITRRSLIGDPLRGRALFAFAVAIVTLRLCRCSLMVFLAPLSVINCVIAGWVLRTCSSDATADSSVRIRAPGRNSTMPVES